MASCTSSHYAFKTQVYKYDCIDSHKLTQLKIEFGLNELSKYVATGAFPKLHLETNLELKIWG